jgi:hypothetical protein
MARPILFLLTVGLCLTIYPLPGFCHNISESNARFLEGISGPAIVPFLYLGAKHMVTGYDHLLFIVGVIFFLYRPMDVLLYVSLFTLGHSITLLFGVLAVLQINAFIIDTIIGLSVAYKAFENMGGFSELLKIQIDTRLAVFVFGLFHGLGLATKLQEFALSEDGLVTNIISFNVGVELGQGIALAFILVALWRWRRSADFQKHAFLANTLLMTSGFLLAGYHISGYLLVTPS